jgi:hypothetical protein
MSPSAEAAAASRLLLVVLVHCPTGGGVSKQNSQYSQSRSVAARLDRAPMLVDNPQWLIG